MSDSSDLQRNTEIEFLRQYLNDTSEDFECLPLCDSDAHEDDCPVVNIPAGWHLKVAECKRLKAVLKALVERLDRPTYMFLRLMPEYEAARKECE